MNSTFPLQPSCVNIQNGSYDTIPLHALLEPFGGMKHYINKGEHVLLKTNLLIPSEPQKAVVTHPAILKALISEILDHGGVPFIGDSPSGQFTKRRLEKAYQKSGLTTLANEMGINLNYDTTITKIDIPSGKKLKKTQICNFVLNADKIIAVPKLKTHSYMIMTLASKIMYGAVPGLTKAKYHSLFIRRTSFADMLLDVLSIRKPDLIVMDGIIGMQGEGPSNGTPVELGVLIASEDAIAMDIAVCDILDIEPMQIPTLRQAKIRHLWPSSIDYPLIHPDEIRYKGFLLPSSAESFLSTSKNHQQPIPTEKCTACGQCVEICPKNAIQIKNHKAVVNYTKCISCYCCHEICPYNAITLGYKQ